MKGEARTQKNRPSPRMGKDAPKTLLENGQELEAQARRL